MKYQSQIVVVIVFFLNIVDNCHKETYRICFTAEANIIPLPTVTLWISLHNSEI